MKLTPIAYSLALAGLTCSLNVQAASSFIWTGSGPDIQLDTATNWNAGAPTTLTDAVLIFDAANVGAGSFTVNNNLITAPVYNSLQFSNGGFTVTGGTLALRPYVAPGTVDYSTTNVIINQTGVNTISAPLRIDTSEVDRMVTKEKLDNAGIVVQNGSLALGGAITAGQINLSTSVGSGASLSMNGVSAKSFQAYGGTQNLAGVLDSKTVSLQSTNFTVGGAAGSINAVGGGVAVGTSNYYNTNSATLTLDNTSVASNSRLNSTASMTVNSGSTLLLKGHATTDVVQNAGALIVNGNDSTLTTHVKVEGAGANASLVFGSLSTTGLVNFASSGVLGDKERIKFNTVAPALTDGLMSKAMVNGHEFASYDATKGVVAATNASSLVGALSTHNVYVSAGETLTGGATAINSLTVNNAAIAATGAHAISLASGKLLTSGTVSIAPSIDFGAKSGQIINLGTTVLAGGVNGSNGLNVLGNGSLELAGAGNLTGNFTHGGQLVLSANNALQGADVSSSSGLDIQGTTQNFNSFSWSGSSGSNVSGTGKIVAANNINLNQSLVNVSLEGKTMTVSASTINGDIQASQNVNLYSGVMNGKISGAANVRVYATLTNQNTYTGTTTGNLTLSGNGAIAASSGFGSGSLTIRAADGDVGALDRVGNSAAVNLGAYSLLSLQGSGSVALHEDIGALNVTNTISTISRLELSNGSGSGASTSLRADSLNLSSGSSLVVSLGGSSSLFVDAAPITYSGGTNVLKNVYFEKSIGGKTMHTWAAYDGSNGRISETLGDEQELNLAASGTFVRVTDATNQALNASRTVGGVHVDTTGTMTGSGALTVGSGQMLFSKDNTISVAGLSFGTQQGVLSNAGTNTITSGISGSNGMVKQGQGEVVLTANSAASLTGTTQVLQGALTVANGGGIGNVTVASGSTLNLAGTAQKIISNDGTVNLNTTHTNAVGNAIGGYGTLNVGANASLINNGTIGTRSYYDQGSLNVNASGSLTNQGIINAYVSNLGGLTNAANATVNGLTNNGTVINNGTVKNLSNSGAFTNNGTLVLDNGYMGGTVVNYGTATLNKYQTASGNKFTPPSPPVALLPGEMPLPPVELLVQAYTQNSGITYINGDFYGDVVLNGGRIQGSGRVIGNWFQKAGTVAPGNSPGVFEVTGDMTIDEGAILDMEVMSVGSTDVIFDQLNVGGKFTRKGAIKLNLGTGVNFSDNGTDEFTSNGKKLILADMFSTNLLATLAGTVLDVATADGTVKTLSVTTAMATATKQFVFPQPAAVPVPAAAWLLGSGLLGLIGVARRKAVLA